MTKYFAVICIALLSQVCFAGFEGTWEGTLYLENAQCEPTSIKITQTEDQLQIVVNGEDTTTNQYFILCDGSKTGYNFGLSEQLRIIDDELWGQRNSNAYSLVGDLTTRSVLTRDWEYDTNKKKYRYWDFVNLKMLKGNTMLISLNYDGLILSGELMRKDN